jgi:putative copper resistance protein D
MASFAWTGHGAMDEGLAGLTHLVADLIHLGAAGVWLGALVAMAVLAMRRRVAEDPTAMQALHDGLKGFSGIGTAVVALLVLTGLVNSWFLIGLDHLGQILQSIYATTLGIKLLVFVAMLGLAALNRYRLTPRLGRGLVDGAPASALDGLRTSIVMETAGGLVVLGLVAVLGTLPPLSMN